LGDEEGDGLGRVHLGGAFDPAEHADLKKKIGLPMLINLMGLHKKVQPSATLNRQPLKTLFKLCNLAAKKHRLTRKA
jgi:hypothetical protein